MKRNWKRKKNERQVENRDTGTQWTERDEEEKEKINRNKDKENRKVEKEIDRMRNRKRWKMENGKTLRNQRGILVDRK